MLSHFLLEADGFELRTTATDMEVTARTTCHGITGNLPQLRCTFAGHYCRFAYFSLNGSRTG
jgi:hypothetical protein